MSNQRPKKSHSFTQGCLQSHNEQVNITAKQEPDCKGPINFIRIVSFLAWPPPPQLNYLQALEPGDDTQCMQGCRMSINDLI